MNVHTRRWFCDEPTCPRKIFAERFDGALARYARRTVVADNLLRTFALQAGGDGRRSLDLDHEVYRAHVDPELERGSGDDGGERAALEPILHLLALVARD